VELFLHSAIRPMTCTVLLHLVIFDKEWSLSGNLHYQWRSFPAASSLSGQMFTLEPFLFRNPSLLSLIGEKTWLFCTQDYRRVLLLRVTKLCHGTHQGTELLLSIFLTSTFEDVNGELHASAALSLLKKKFRLTNEQEVRRASGRICTPGVKNFSLSRIKCGPSLQPNPQYTVKVIKTVYECVVAVLNS